MLKALDDKDNPNCEFFGLIWVIVDKISSMFFSFNFKDEKLI